MRDDCDDDGNENIDFVQVVVFQGLAITGNFLAENLTFPATDLLTAPLYMRWNCIIACIVSVFTVMYALYAV